MGKNSKIDPVGIVSNKHWISAVLDACPAADPNWGALKKALQAVFDVLSQQTSVLRQVKWDAADFADQLAVLLYHFRKLCSNPGRYFAAIEECKSNGHKAEDLQDLSEKFDLRCSEIHGSCYSVVHGVGYPGGNLRLNDDDKKLVTQVKEKNKQN